MEILTIKIFELPKHLQHHGIKWQADCCNDHARGKTVKASVNRLLAYMKAKNGD